jgi:hypothetical protein
MGYSALVRQDLHEIAHEVFAELFRGRREEQDLRPEPHSRAGLLT